MSSPSNFSKPKIRFKKLNDLPKGRAYTGAEILAAMKVLNHMIHDQAKAYGGKESKLLPAGIAESLIQQAMIDEAATIGDVIHDVQKKLDEAYEKCNQLQTHLAKNNDGEGMDMLHGVLASINSALAAVFKK